MEKVNKAGKTAVDRHKKQVELARLSMASFMSNSKWEKFFIAIKNSEISLHGEIIKNVADDAIRPFNLKKDGLYIFNGKHHRYSTNDSGGGPVFYRDIEWIFVPPHNDINGLKNLIDSLGLYEYDFSEDGMKIYGYK